MRSENEHGRNYNWIEWWFILPFQIDKWAQASDCWKPPCSDCRSEHKRYACQFAIGELPQWSRRHLEPNWACGWPCLFDFTVDYASHQIEHCRQKQNRSQLLVQGCRWVGEIPISSSHVSLRWSSSLFDAIQKIYLRDPRVKAIQFELFAISQWWWQQASAYFH